MADAYQTTITPGDLRLAATVLGERSSTLRAMAGSLSRKGIPVVAGEKLRDAERLEGVSRRLFAEAATHD